MPFASYLKFVELSALIFENLNPKLQLKMQKIAFDGRQILCFFVHSFIIYIIRSRQYKHILDEYNHRNRQNPPFYSLHVALIEQFEGPRTFTNFTEPLLPKKRKLTTLVIWPFGSIFGQKYFLSFCNH
jgi:hypothetical protein